ncbi:MAG: glycosyltransferase family 4 protein, partial [Gemmatimonadaceae bacterium]
MTAPLRVAFDHQIFSGQRYGGISRYLVELVRHLSVRDDCTVSVLALAHANAYLASLPGTLVRGWSVPNVRRTGRLRQRVNDVVTRMLLGSFRPDIVHETYYSAWRLAPVGVPTVVTVHDMTHERFPRYFPDAASLARRKAAAVRRAAHVICVSENTRRDLLELIPIDPERVSVIHLASSLPSAATPARTGPRRDGRPYLLFVGDRRGYKNFSMLLDAMLLLPAGLRHVRLIAFGGGPFGTAELQHIALLGDSVVQVSGGDQALAELYSNAAALVYPSLYEGFGIPIVEAMACGCPVICSDTGSLPEVAGAAAEYCDPRDGA